MARYSKSWLLLLLLTTGGFAAATEFTFTSPLDHFTVDVSDGSATYKGQSVSSEPFSIVKQLFDNELEDACDSGMGRADLSIMRKRDDKEDKRLIYFEKKMISDGKNCAALSGAGIYQLPLHHNWFTENKKNLSIVLGGSFSILKNGKTVVEFEKTQRGFKNKDPNFFTNWEYFEKFIETLKEFPVAFRAHPSAAKAFASFELQQGKRKFTFVKLGNKTWAVHLPGTPWLAASGQFGLFDDMDQRLWVSPFEKSLKIIKDSSANIETRTAAVRTLGNSFSPDIKYVFFEVLLSSEENTDIKKEIIALMRSRPTDENFLVLVESLDHTEDLGLMSAVTKVLRLRNPKGIVIQEDDSAENLQKKRSDWKAWAKLTLQKPQASN